MLGDILASRQDGEMKNVNFMDIGFHNSVQSRALVGNTGASSQPRSRTSSGKYCCSECNKCFATSWGLQKHRASHTGDYKYLCALCQRGFMEILKYDNHMKSHKRKMEQHKLL